MVGKKDHITTYKDFVDYVTKLGKGACFDGDRGIDSLLHKVSRVTEQTTEDIIICSDFKKEELHIEKLEAIIAEMRAIMFLKNNGFGRIQLLKKKKTKCPDISAEKNKNMFDVEVTCLTAKHSKQNSNNQISDILPLFLNKIREKIPQLEEGVNSQKMLVMVMNRFPKEVYGEEDFRQKIKEAYTQSKLSDCYYLGLVTGDVDFIYPEII